MNSLASHLNSEPAPFLLAQQSHVRGLSAEQRDALIISARKVDGNWVVLSRYGDARWKLLGKTTNRKFAVDFDVVEEEFRDPVRQAMYRFHMHGRAGGKRPEASTVIGLFNDLKLFIKYLRSCSITRLNEVRRLVCISYVKLLKEHRIANGKPLKAATVDRKLRAVETLFELSQHTTDPMPVHPWPETSAKHMAGLSGSVVRQHKTPLIPDHVFTSLFRTAWSIVERGPALLDLRDEMARIKAVNRNRHFRTSMKAQSNRLLELGWQTGLDGLASELKDIRRACYVVLASVSGCRNHELAWLQTGAFFSTQSDADADCTPGRQADAVWWMRSVSAKTDEGLTTWMIPHAGVEALSVMERWALPYQEEITEEIAVRRATDLRDPEIAEAQRHSKALFLV